MAQQISGLGIDSAKLVCHVIGMDDPGHVVFRKRLLRRQWLSCIAKLSPRHMGMEACGSDHDWAHHFRAHGHEVRLIAPPFLKQALYRPGV